MQQRLELVESKDKVMSIAEVEVTAVTIATQ
jgi:hypothetical protein